MNLRNLFLKFGIFVLPVFGALSFSGETFALGETSEALVPYNNGGSSGSYYDERIKELNDERVKNPKTGKDYDGLIECLNIKKRIAGLQDKLYDKETEIYKNPANSEGLTVFDGFGFSKLFNMFDTGLNEVFKKVGMFNDFGSFGPFNNLSLDLNRRFKQVSERMPEQVKKLQKSRNPGIVVLDGKNNVKFEQSLTKKDIKKIKEDSKNSSLVEVVNKILAMKGSSEKVSEKDGYFVAVNLGNNNFVCASKSSDGTGNHFSSSSFSYHNNYGSLPDGKKSVYDRASKNDGKQVNVSSTLEEDVE